MEDLTKTQLVLLTLFVSFITSIATGIVTVTLLDEAPAEVTRTIDRVVERTIERVIPGRSPFPAKEVVLVREENQIPKAAKEGLSKIVRIGLKGDPNTARHTGFIVSPYNLLVTTAEAVADRAQTYSSLDGEIEKDVEVVAINAEKNFAILKFKEAEKISEKKSLRLNAETPLLGETVISIGIDEELAIGVVNAVRPDPAGSSSPDIKVAFTTGRPKLGNLLLGLEANLIGVLQGDGSVLSVTELDKAISVINNIK